MVRALVFAVLENPVKSVVAVTLDAEGTLLHPFPSVGAVYAEILGGHGISADAASLETSFRSAFEAANIDRRNEVSDRSEREFWKIVVRQTLDDCSSDDRFEAIFDELYREFGSARRWELVEDAIPTIRALRDRGYLVGILSNWDSRLRQVLSELKLDSLLDACFVSCEIGFEKPDLRIFRFVENALALKPSEILHVGNSLEQDAEGAKNAGWHYLIVKNGETGLLENENLISNLAELLDILPNR